MHRETLVLKLHFTNTIRGASEACDQAVVTYRAGANECGDKEVCRKWSFN